MAVGSKVGEAYIELTAKMAKFEAQLRSAKMLTGTATAKMQTGMSNVTAATKGTSAAMKLLKVAIGAISFIAIAMAFKKIIQATAQFEDAQLELRKTSGMTREEIDKFSNRMKNMASTMPTSTTGLLEIAAAAARLGIQGSDNLAAFSETVIKMATATQYTEEQASLDFAKIANVMKLPYSEIGRLGSAMNELANTTTATAPIIGDFTRRVAGAGSTLGLTIPQLTAMGATLDSLGVTTQVAGTAMSNFFTKMLTKAKTFADQAGMEMEEWNHLVEVDAWEALQKWLSAMDQMKPIERAQALGELGMEGARMTDVLMKLSGAQEQLNVNLATSQKAFEENTSLEKEYQIALEGLSAQWSIFTGNVTNLAITIGAKLSPALKEIMKGLNVLIDGLQFLIKNWSLVWKSAYQILIVTLEQIGHGIKKFFTDWSVFKAGLNLWFQYGKALLMIMTRTLEMLAGLIVRASSVIWAPYIKTLQWVADNMVYYFRLGIEDARNAIIKGVNWITSKVFTPMANFFIDVANKMTEGAQAFVNFFISGMNMVVKAIKPVISALGWFAEHILRKELPEGIKEFGEIAEVEFKKIEKLGEDALTIEIPESTLKQPAKFTARMSEAWAIIKDQYSKIPGDLRKYVDDLAMEWENVTRAAGEFGEAVDWSDYKARLAEIIKKLKAAGVETSALEKEQEKLNKRIVNIRGPMGDYIEAVTNLMLAYEPMPRIFKEIKTGISDFKNGLAGIGAVISAGLSDLFTWAGKWEGMPRIFKEVKIGASEMINSLAGIGVIISEGLPDLFSWTGKWEGMPRIFKEIKIGASDMKNSLAGIGLVIAEGLPDLFIWKGLLEVMPRIFKDVKIGLSKMENSLASVGSVITKGLPKLFIWEDLWEGMPRIFKEVKIGASEMKNSLAGVGTIIAKGLPKFFEWSGLWEGMPRIFREIKIGASTMKNSLAGIGTIIAKGLPDLFTWSGLWEGMPRIFNKVKIGASELANSLASLGAIIAAGLPDLFKWKGLLEPMPRIYKEVEMGTSEFESSLASLGGTTAKGLPLYAQLNEEFQGMPLHLDKIVPAAAYASASIANLGQVMYDTMQEGIEITKTVADNMKKIWEGLTRYIKWAWEDFFIDIISGTESLKDAFQSLGEAIKRAFIEAFAKALVEKMGFDKIFEGNILNWGNLLKGIGHVIVSTFKGIGNVISSVFGVGAAAPVTQSITAAGNAAAQTGTQMGIMAKIGLGLQKVVTGIGGALSYFANMGSTATTVLGALGQGLVGVAGFVGTAVASWTAFSYLAENVIGPALSGIREGLTDFLGISGSVVDSIESMTDWMGMLGQKFADAGTVIGDAPQVLELYKSMLISATKDIATGVRQIGDLTREESIAWMHDAITNMQGITEEYRAQLLGILEASTISIEEIEKRALEAHQTYYDELGELDRKNRHVIERGHNATAKMIAEQVAATEKAIEETTGAARASFEKQLWDLQHLQAYGSEMYWALYKEAKQSLKETEKAAEEATKDIEKDWTELTKDTTREAQRTWGRSGAVPIALNEAVNAMTRKIGELPTRIDFDVIGNLSMPDIPHVGSQSFDIWGEYHAPSIPSYRAGIPYVPRTTLAVLHRGEEVVPAHRTRAEGGQGGTQIVYERGAIRMFVQGSINQQVDLNKAMDYLARKQAEKMRRP